MEGIGYWIFLAVLYLLSALMKKRQRQSARQQLDQEESGSPAKEKPKPFQAEFLQDLFGDMKNMVEDQKVKIRQQVEDFDIVEKKSVPEVEPKADYVHEEQDHVVFEDLSDLDPKPIHEEYQYWKKGPEKNRAISPLFRSMDDLKRAIVLKEILDKPRAMRRSIR